MRASLTVLRIKTIVHFLSNQTKHKSNGGKTIAKSELTNMYEVIFEISDSIQFE